MSADELYAYVTADEPPMSLSAEGVLALNRRRRRARLLASIGGGAAVAVAAVVFWAQLPGPADPAVPAAACLREVPVDRSAPGDVTVDPLASSTLVPAASPAGAPVSEQMLSQVACTMIHSMRRLLPSARFYPHDLRARHAFEPYWFQAATPRSDHDGAIITVGRIPGAGQVAAQVGNGDFDAPPPTEQSVRTDPLWRDRQNVERTQFSDGSVLISFQEFSTMDDLILAKQFVAEYWTGHNHITVVASDLTATHPTSVSGRPPLTIDQVRELVQDPGFAVFD